MDLITSDKKTLCFGFHSEKHVRGRIEAVAGYILLKRFFLFCFFCQNK